VGYWTTTNPPTFTTLASTNYFYDPTGNKIIVTGMPSEINQVITNPIVALYTTAASSYAAYPVIQQAGLMILTHLYNNRSDTTSTNLKQIPMGAAALLRPYKPLVL
jgi:hypothetical protein